MSITTCLFVSFWFKKLETSADDVSSQADDVYSQAVETAQPCSTNLTFLKGEADDSASKTSNVRCSIESFNKVSDLRDVLFARSKDRLKSSTSCYSDDLPSTSRSSDLGYNVRHMHDLKVCDSHSDEDADRKGSNTRARQTLSDSKRRDSLKYDTSQSMSAVQPRDLRTYIKARTSDVESDRSHRTDNRFDAKRSSSCRERRSPDSHHNREYRTSARSQESRRYDDLQSSRSHLKEEHRLSSRTTKTILAQDDRKKCPALSEANRGAPAEVSQIEQNSTSASSSYQLVLTRHVKQLFLRGDNVIFVTVVGS